ncbi:hypothetical protein E2C01_019460 [Portunus trituberculatus]|uniref:Uncharacterized protein n=1 Tax=Portunus trituberculatus TaxID=210409 RepID=A0A5B7DYC0_PORTR|nr:hypothetical protein [Portunus trituberculatus]
MKYMDQTVCTYVWFNPDGKTRCGASSCDSTRPLLILSLVILQVLKLELRYEVLVAVEPQSQPVRRTSLSLEHRHYGQAPLAALHGEVKVRDVRHCALGLHLSVLSHLQRVPAAAGKEMEGYK